MLPEIKLLKKDFEKELWLYIDNSLSEKRKNFWEEKFIQFPELKEMLDENINTLNHYDEISESDLLDSTFQKIVKNTVIVNNQKKSFAIFTKLNPFKYFETSTIKIAFGSILAITSITILLLSNRPNPIKDISQDLLKWNPNELNEKFKDVTKSIMIVKDKEILEYYQHKMANDKWKRDVYNINKSINKIKNEIDDKTL